ncbi:MAG: OmpA family protein [Sphingobacteriales bacterium]|nr:MAG: OmpA family protein [Sphingobacteriales bacterium]
MKKILFCFLLTCFALQLHAQDIPGYNNSNYAGISGFHLNPASIADSRYKFDMNIIGGGIGFYNNYVGFRRKTVGQLRRGETLDKDFLREGVNSNRISINNQNYAQLPSFMVTVSPKIALAFNFRVRSLINMDRVNPELAKLGYNGFDVPSLFNLKLNNDEFSLNAMAWGEYGVGYAQTLKSKGKHFLKAGGQAKIITGIGAAYFYARDLNYSWKNKDTLSLFQSQFGYGHSDNFDINTSNIGYKYVTKPSLGFDVGVVYEFRPKSEKYMYDLDGETNLQRRDQDKYLFRIGASLLDIGRVKFTKSPNSNDFDADIRDWDVGQIKEIKNIDDFNDTIRKRFGMKQSVGTFNMALPTAFSVQVDYNIYKNFYANFTTLLSPRIITDESKVHGLSYYRITPRWDHKWFGAFLPMSLNGFGQFNLGTALRLGPLVLGSSNIGNLLVGKYVTGLDLHFAVKIPIMYGKPKDKDHDGVSNKKDKCPKEKGSWQTLGCPDRDGDFIVDAEDKCPDVRGVKELNGCPDADGDGITDKDDNCPESAGLKENNGCPDTDKDGIIDLVDKCKDVKGTKEMQGCPDTDKDGISDLTDNCPEEAGPITNNGCPFGDLDKDGVPDKDDKCPEIAGDLRHFGCPDSDKDGIYDDEDKCPQTVGVPENGGCPVIEAAEKEVVNTAFNALELEANSANIKETSYPTLNKLAELLQSKPNWKLKISGHTDNVGNEQANLDLSRRRALAVKTYLVSKGIKEDRIRIEYYGASKPIDTNDTPEGRQKNRRVEMEIVFD